ncbi:phosphoribosylanthranilate isomerase [Saccharicrinis sp. FJH54]|uniref:phosphoribosylanthranilate isomerase n=1 Tax=Saccharicrinis sp. FJH54 TaxID=3344665 RepID=UPI0035D48882
MKIKVCGMLYKDNIKDVAALNPDLMGFIFYPKSPRYVVGKLNPEILVSLPPSIIKTGVFVNETFENILDLAKIYDLTAFQLHGEESPQFCDRLRDLGFIIIKAFRIDEDFDFKQLKSYELSCDYFLFDTKTSAYGGSGKKFDWNILNRYNNSKPIFLSGGIGPGDESVISGLSNLNIYALDLNSKFEIEPGFKDVKQLTTFVTNIRMNEPKWNF